MLPSPAGRCRSTVFRDDFRVADDLFRVTRRKKSDCKSPRPSGPSRLQIRLEIFGVRKEIKDEVEEAKAQSRE